MMHWFDRLSRSGISPDPGLTRREAVARIGAASLSLSVLGLAAAPSQAAPPRTYLGHASSQSDACQGCIDACSGAIRDTMAEIGKQFLRPDYYLFPASAAATSIQILSADITYRHELANCAETVCNRSATKPQPNAPPDPQKPEENGGCPPGTHKCAGALCCYGSDICCTNSDGTPTCCIVDVGCACTS
jgi:hypothetical protein